MKRKVAVTILATTLALGMLTACGSSSSGTSTSSTTSASTEKAAEEENQAAEAVEATDLDVTVIIKNTTTPFFLSMKAGAEQAGADLGLNVSVQAPTDTDQGAGNEQQTSLAEQAIASQVDCVVLCPVDSQAIVPAVEKLVDAKIPVIDLNTRFSDESLAETFVGLENFNQGYNTMMTLLNGMNNEGTLFIIEGTTGAQTSIDRVEGALAAIEESGANVEILAQQSGNYSRAEAMNVVQNLLQSYPDVNAIFCCNDEMALGTVEAVDAAGLAGNILITGQDANDDAVEAIKAGTMYASSYGNPYMQGYLGVQAAYDVLVGGGATSDFYEVETIDVTLDNVETFAD